MDVNRSVFDQPLIFTYRPPYWLPVFISFSYVGGIICLLLTSIPSELKLIMTLSVCLGFALWLRNFRYKLNINTRIILNKKDEWHVINSDMRAMKVSLKSASILLSELIFLRLKDKNHRSFDFILTTQSADTDTLRRLRVRLYYPRTRIKTRGLI